MCSMQEDLGVYEGLQWLATVLKEELINSGNPLVQQELMLAMQQAFGRGTL